MNRKDFVRSTALATASLVIPAGSVWAGEEAAPVKVALIGTGLRGQEHLELLLARKDVKLVAICDISNRMLDMARELIKKSGKKAPVVYTGSDYSWKDLLEKEKVEAVVIATPWEWHKPMVMGALERGVKYV